MTRNIEEGKIRMSYTEQGTVMLRRGTISQSFWEHCLVIVSRVSDRTKNPSAMQDIWVQSFGW